MKTFWREEVRLHSFDVHGTVHRCCILLSITNKMQRYTVFFIIVNALHVSGGETDWNMYSIDSNKEYCIMLHLVGYT